MLSNDLLNDLLNALLPLIVTLSLILRIKLEIKLARLRKYKKNLIDKPSQQSHTVTVSNDKG